MAQIRKCFDMICTRALSRRTKGEVLADKQMTQEKIADSWIVMESFRLMVLRTAWRIDRYKDYLRVRKDIAAIKVILPKVWHDIAGRTAAPRVAWRRARDAFRRACARRLPPRHRGWSH